MVGPPDACGASRSWHHLAEWEQCGEIDSARLMVVVGSLTIRRPECSDPDPCSVHRSAYRAFEGPLFMALRAYELPSLGEPA